MIVGVLLALAVLGLIVGVSNDAVNFMNSAIGSKAAPRKYIVLIAGLGIIFGVLLSSGMMEVARKGIFNPGFFVMPELLIIFLAVMLQNVLLLDLFNTYGLPTSTTVSVVFGLFGGAFAISAIKVHEAGESFNLVFTQYINTANVITIVSAIFLSIFIAFIVGSLVQYLVRFILTFDFEKRFRRYGSMLGGFALTMITYFILIKGSKGASFMTEETILWIKNHTWEIFGVCFVFWTLILQLMMWFTKINILRVIVLIGTFALAMAFAANDLVNFIGAPLAGLKAFELAGQAVNPLTEPMTGMAEKVPANTLLLLIAGIIMGLTLLLSKKARTVTKTEVSLGRQDAGFERFESYVLSRMVVRMFVSVVDFFSKFLPERIKNGIRKRFDSSKFNPPADKDGDKPAFDLVRAAVNLMVAAGLISIATNNKLPLSTTYVTFIVAMATALPDGAWGRESAVYRVSGVLTVIGGWFLTAIIGTLVAMMIAALIYYGQTIATVIILVIAAILIYRSARLHKEREEETSAEEAQQKRKGETPQQIIDLIFDQIATYFETVHDAARRCYVGLMNEKSKKLKKSKKRGKKTNKKLNSLIIDILKLTSHENKDLLKSGHIYARNLSSLTGISDHLNYMVQQSHDYINNLHNPFTDDQKKELGMVCQNLESFTELAVGALRNKNFDEISKIEEKLSDTQQLIEDLNNIQLGRIKQSTTNLRRSRLYLENLSDTDRILSHMVFVCKISKEVYDLITPNDEEINSEDAG